MATTSSELEDIVVFVLTEPSDVTEQLYDEELTISTVDIHNWNIPSIVCYRIVKVQADRSRLSQKSCYFHGLLDGNFSESSLHHISICWSIESILNVLQFIYGHQLIVTSTNFLRLLEAALFFGVDSLLLKCEAWFQNITSGFGLCRHQISLAAIIEISNFSLEHGMTYIMGTCKDYLARNFAWAASSCSFVDIPYALLSSTIEHPELTIESEVQLCEALLGWLSQNVEFGECFSINSKHSYYDILKKVSMQSLNYVIKRNPEMRSLRVTGCPKLHQGGGQNLAYTYGMGIEDFLDELGKRCMLEELALGWGFSSIGLERLQPAFGKLRAIHVGLGAEVDHYFWCFIPKICPLLESLVLRFQVISDDIVRGILESLKHLQMLWLCCCLGYFTLLSFQIQKLNLTSLKLDWVTPWMTNNDLTVLTLNCSKVFELSLSGCKLLDSDSQKIIASGWPGLKYLHLEECGKITSKGVSFLFNCKAIEELLLRHNGQGLARNFIMDAASKLPLLRKLSLDLCDAVQGGLDSPSHSERFYLSTVKICRCKAQRCAFELEKLGGFKPVHKETIVLEYTSKQLRTTVVKERI